MGAVLYIEAEGGTGVAWPESERASQRVRSVYGSDVYAAFVDANGRTLPTILAQCAGGGQVAGVSVESEVQRMPGANLAARQLHFVAECSDEGLEKVKQSLANALTSFHVEAERYAQAAEGL